MNHPLPLLHDSWEVSVLGPPENDSDPPGVLVVVEARSGKLRTACQVRWGTPLDDAFEAAFHSPKHGLLPGRPLSIRVAKQTLLDELRPVLVRYGTLATVSDSLPAVHAALSTLLGLDIPRAPGLRELLPQWRIALAALAHLTPWRRLDNDVHFVFQGAGLDERVALCIGQSSKSEGFLLFASINDLDNYFHAPDTPHPSAPGNMEVMMLLLEPEDSVTGEERRACRTDKLVFGGLVPRAYVTQGEVIRALRPEEEHLLLAAIQAIAGLCQAELPRIGSGIRRRKVPVVGGMVDVEAGVGLSPLVPIQIPPLFNVKHSVAFNAKLRAVHFRMPAADAMRLKPTLATVLEVKVSEQLPTGVFLTANVQDTPSEPVTARTILGPLVGTVAQDALRLTDGPGVTLSLHGGGQHPKLHDPKDLVAETFVPVSRA